MPTATKPRSKTRAQAPGPDPMDFVRQNMPPRSAVDFQWYAANNLTTEKGQPLEFEERPYLKGIYDCLSKEKVFKKAAQVGMSGFEVNQAIWRASHRPMTVIYILPTDGDVREFSQARFNPITQKSNIIADMEVDNVSIKRIGHSFVYFRGAWNERAALTVPSDSNVYDELDRCKPDIVQTYNERLSASSMGYKDYLSTPTYPDIGIDAKWKESDQREWFVLCQKCGLEQVLTVEHIHFDSDAYRCERCKDPLDNRRGRWKATAESAIAGFHPTQLICPWIRPQTIIDKRDKADFKKDFFNLVLGQTYASGTQSVQRVDILGCIEDSVSNQGQACMGVDWGDTSWFVIRKPGRIIHYGKIKGDTRTHPAQVMRIADKFSGCRIVADFGYGDTKNQELIDKRPRGTVWMCIYAKDGNDIYPRFVDKDNEVHVDRTTSLQHGMEDITERRVQIQRNTDVDPEEKDKKLSSLQELFIQHYTNLFEKKETDKHGSMRVTIESKGPDHLAHADNYASLLERKKDEGQPHITVGDVGLNDEDENDDF